MKINHLNNYEIDMGGVQHSINILKGICILFVVITHYKWSDNTRDLLLFPFWIDMAVPLFMVVSGYVNSLSYIRNSISSFEQVYTIRFLTPKVMRLLLPFMIACFVEFLGEMLVKGKVGLSFL